MTANKAPEHLQPLSTLGPMPDKRAEENRDPDDPVYLEYLEARGFLERGDYARAAMGFHNAMHGYEDRGDRAGMANASDRLGDACMGRAEYGMALANYERAYRICVEEDDSFSQLALNKKMMQCCRKLGQLDRALAILDDMLEHYRLMKNPKGAVETLEHMAEAYLEQGERAKAADSYRAAAGIHQNFRHARMAEELRQKAVALERD